MEKNIDRRTFLSYLGTGTAAFAAASAGLGTLEGKASAMSPTADHLFGFGTNKVSGYFEPIGASKEDKLMLPKGFKYDVVAAFDDVINSAGEKVWSMCTTIMPFSRSTDRIHAGCWQQIMNTP